MSRDAWQQINAQLSPALSAAARQLVEGGAVSEVRVAQQGAVITGVAGAQRVYVLCRGVVEAECSCGAQVPCEHVAAVLSVAADAAQPAVAAAAQPAAVVGAAASDGSQRLYYLLEPDAASAGGVRHCRLQLSLWVGTSPRSADLCRYAPRLSGSGGFPRFVAAGEQPLLQVLLAQQSDGPWPLRGAAAADLMQPLMAGGRLYWREWSGAPLQRGAALQSALCWRLLPNGDQYLDCDAPDSLRVVLDCDPPLYVDTQNRRWGELQLPCAAALARRYWERPPVPPEQADALNRELAGSAVPPLHTQTVHSAEPARPAARLRLAAHEGTAFAALYFLYHGAAVNSATLPADAAVVRQRIADQLYEIRRDRAAEQALQARLDAALAARAAARPRGATLPTREAWLAFMVNGLPALRDDGWEVEIDAAFPYRLAGAERWYGSVQETAAPRRRFAGDWFNLRLGVVVEGRELNLLPALAAFLQARMRGDTSERIDAPAMPVAGGFLFVPLEDGRYLPVALPRIERIAQTLVELFDEHALDAGDGVVLPASQAGRLLQLAEDVEAGREALWSGADALLRLAENMQTAGAATALSPPEQFRAQLRRYQQEGLGWLQWLRRCGAGGILADDMGLGKTVQTLAHLALEKQQGRLQRPALIVAPTSVIGNWLQETRRFAPMLKPLLLHGARRRAAFAGIAAADVVITSYALLPFDAETLLAQHFSLLILDEAQTVKNPRAKVSQIARALRAEHRLCLTGTPLENHLGELWSLFDCLQPGLLGDERQFQRHYRAPIEKHADAERARGLARRIAPFLLRRTKDAIAEELPAKTEIVERIVLEERQRDLYDGIRLAMHREIRDVIARQGLARSRLAVLDALLKMRQACCDPRLLQVDGAGAAPSAKLEWLRGALPELVAEGRRVLLFSQFTSMLELIEDAVRDLAIPYLKLTGASSGRSELVERFQSGAAPLFLISLKAGGTGLNLTAADTVIHYDPWWNPAVQNQATDRAYRIGQDKPVFVYKLIAEGTVEEKILQLQADKSALADALYQGTGAAPGTWNEADLEALFA